MNKYPALQLIRKKKQAEKRQMACAHAFLALFRVGVRLREFFGPPKRRQRIRQLREKVAAIEHDKQIVLAQIKNKGVSQGLDALHEMQMRYSRPEDQGELNQSRANILAMRQESEALQHIRKASEGNKAAVQGYQEYIVTHPDSSMAHSYLSGVLEKLGDLEGSTAELREAIRVAKLDSIRGVAARLDLGQVLRKQGHKEAAIAEFQSLIENATPKTQIIICRAFLELGISLNEIGNHHEARAAWKQAIQWDTTKIIAKQAREMLQTNP